MSIATSLQANRSLLQRFYNLSLSRKQLIALITCEIFSILGISIATTLILNQRLQTQQIDQAKLELEVTDINYNFHFQEMDFSHSYLNNSAVLKALTINNSGEKVSRNLQLLIKKNLRNRTQALRIDYATLVGKDSKVIVNSNNNLQEKFFNHNNFVREFLSNHRHTKATRIMSWSKLNQESLNSHNASDINALIRYIITPVRDPKTKTVIGALMTGKIVDSKDAIANFQKTPQILTAGYSAIYSHQPNGKFKLVTSLLKEKSTDLNQTQKNIELPPENISLLTAAVAASGGTTVTQRMSIGNQTYIMAAKALPNIIIEENNGNRVIYDTKVNAILVRGRPATSINNFLTQDWLLQIQILIAVVGLLFIVLWTLILRRSIVQPLKNLQQNAQKLAVGDRNVRAEVFADDEIGQLAISFNSIASSMTEQLDYQQDQAKLTLQLNKITANLREVLISEKILNTAVSDIRDSLQSDRVLFYQLNERWQAKIIAESVSDSFSGTLEKSVYNPDLMEEYSDNLEIGFVKAVDDIYDSNISQSYLQQLESLAVRAYLLTPIFLNKKLYGLLVVHQCRNERIWQDIETNLFRQVAIQIGYALEQAELIQQIKQGSQTTETYDLEEQQPKQVLQTQLIKLIDDVEDVVRGDLTVRANVSEGEMGTVADFFNSIVESLRDIIAKVKISAIQLDEAIAHDETNIRELTQQTVTQTTEISRILDAVEQMAVAIQAVASSAQQAAQVANSVAHNANNSREAIDTTVQNISNLREIVSKTTNKVKRLGESTQQISHVVALINQISIQTNLLAINAGIEAARGGEESQGFVVVAEEVGDLAARSAQATREIAEIVENIQQETSEVVEAMQLGVTQVAKGTRTVEDAKHSLSQILDVSQQIDALVQSISTATVYSVQTSQTVSELMKQVATTCKDTSKSSMQVSESLQQTVKISHQLKATMSHLKVN